MSNINISLDLIRTIHNSSDRRTKVVCTLGPACWSVEGLIALIDAGTTPILLLNQPSYTQA